MKILVPVDGSASSMQGVNAAVDLAKSKGAGVYLLVAVSPVADFDHEISVSQRDAITDSMLRHAEEILEKAKSVLVSNGILPQCEIITDASSIAKEICDFVEKTDIDLVIIGRKGQTRIERAIMGSVTARVIGCSPVDVLVVPRDVSIKWENILVATDGSKCSDIAVEGAIDIARTQGAELTVVSVVDVPDEAYAEAPSAMDELTERAKKIAQSGKEKAEVSGVTAHALVGTGDAYATIVDIANKTHADVITMGNHGRTGLRRFLMGSVTEKVIGSAQCPVLVVKKCS